jgi:transposase
MSTRQQKYRHFDAAAKVKILREHLIERTPISDVCQKYGIAPTQFYQWQKTFFENGTGAFEKKNNKITNSLQQQNVLLNQKLLKKDQVIAELVEHNINLKKNLDDND